MDQEVSGGTGCGLLQFVTSSQILKLRFPRDLRINEVKKMLNSSQPVKINLEQKPEVR